MPKTSATINVKNLHYARMITEDAFGKPPTYAKPVPMATETVKITITPNAQTASAYGDGTIAESYTGVTGGTVALQIHALPLEDAVALFGNTIDANGVKITSGDDVSPYTAIGFQTEKGNGHEVWVWLYKVKMQMPEFVVDTKTNTVTFQQPTISGEWMSRNDDAYKVDGKAKAVFKAELDQDSPAFDRALADAWFDEVYEPESVTAIP